MTVTTTSLKPGSLMMIRFLLLPIFIWCANLDIRQLLDEIEEDVMKGGYIIDWHVCDVFPKSWIDLVVVLRADSTILYDRLKGRNYPGTDLLVLVLSAVN